MDENQKKILGLFIKQIDKAFGKITLLLDWEIKKLIQLKLLALVHLVLIWLSWCWWFYKGRVIEIYGY